MTVWEWLKGKKSLSLEFSVGSWTFKLALVLDFNGK